MKFSLGGSTGKYWNVFADNFRKGGEFGKLTGAAAGSLSQTRDYLATQGGGTIGENLLHARGTGDFNKGLNNMAKTGQHWSEQLNPLWEGGLSGTGGSLHQDLLPWMEETGMKASHHLSGSSVAGYGSSGKSSGGGSSAVVSSDSEDPSLINQGDWQNPGTIDSFLRRENMLNRGGLATDLTKSKRGRLNVENLA